MILAELIRLYVKKLIVNIVNDRKNMLSMFIGIKKYDLIKTLQVAKVAQKGIF